MSESDLKAWFLGPEGENVALLQGLAHVIIERAARWRRDGEAPLPASKASPSDGAFEQRVAQLLDYLHTRTVPAFSSRYQAHMGWDLLLPGVVGHLIGSLFPSNNVAYEGSPGTTVLEMLVARDLCRMLGYPDERPGPKGEEEVIKPWGHLVGGGTIGNLEALWAARNLKFLPLALRSTLMQKRFGAALEVTLRLRNGKAGYLKDFDTWELLNVPVDESLALPARAARLLKPEDREAFDNELNAQSVNTKGIHHFLTDGVNAPKILLSHDNHYSLEKAAALLGLGQDALDFVKVDQYGRMALADLRDKLDAYAKQTVPVIAIVANLGSTELGAVDDVANILELRRQRVGSLDFAVHVDAAFGGYHASLLRESDFKLDWAGAAALDAPTVRSNDKVPAIELSEYATAQYRALPEADSIVVDPHKLGFVPYPGGAICYRNSALRDLIKFSAPYLGAIVPQGIAQIAERTDQFVGVFGVEGSRSGGSATAVFLAHSLLRPNRAGYGQLSGKELYVSKRVFAALLSLNEPSAPFRVAAAGEYPEALDELVEIARKGDLEVNDGDRLVLKGCGPDLNLLCYLFNFKRDDGHWNQDLVWLHVYNMLIYGRLELKVDGAQQPLIVSRTIFAGREGTEFIANMLRRLEIAPSEDLQLADLVALRSAEWNPWLTERDPKLATFKQALSSAAEDARREVIGRMESYEPGISDLRAAGLSDLVIATGIVGALGALASVTSSSGVESEGAVERIMEGLRAIQEKLALPDLPQKALGHFAGRQ